MNNRDKEFLQLLAYQFLCHGKLEKASTVISVLKALYPNDSHVLITDSYVQSKQGNPEKALHSAESALRASDRGKTKTFAHFLKGKALWKLGKKEDAESNLNYFLELQREEVASNK